MSSRSPVAHRAVLLFLTAAALAATRPHYGGVLRVEIRESVETPDPPASGQRMAELNDTFSITRWEAGRHAVYSASDAAPGGRPFLDAVDVQMDRPLAEQSIDLETGRADLVELGPRELLRTAPGRRVWTSSPVRLVALVFSPNREDTRAREALALAVDRWAIHNVLLQRQGEVSGGLLPQWISGYAFLFSTAPDTSKAAALAAALPPQARVLSLAVDDPVRWRSVADRIVLNARDAGLRITLAAPSAPADIRLTEVRIASADPARALAAVAAALGLPEPPRSESPEAEYLAERALLEGSRVIPLFHLPYVYGVGPRVRGGPGITPLGEWRFQNVWVEGGRP